MSDPENDKQYLINTVALGHEARALITNKAFIGIMASLERDKNEALVNLAVVDPEDFKKIRNLQNIIYRHDEMTARLTILSQDGDIAQQELSDDLTD